MKPVGAARHYNVQFNAGGEGHLLHLFDSMNRGAFLLDGTGRVIRMNAVAQDLVGKGIDLVGGFLVPAGERAQAGLRQVIATILGSANLDGGMPVRTAVLRDTSGRRLVIHGMQVAVSADAEASKPRGLLLVHDMNRVSDNAAAVLAQAFGLTAAEAKLAVRLSTGAPLAEIAEAQNISLATARSQLAAIFAKTETARQAELVALLTRIVTLAR